MICDSLPCKPKVGEQAQTLKVIDAFFYGDQWLTALDVDSGKIWQANEKGELRMDKLVEDE